MTSWANIAKRNLPTTTSTGTTTATTSVRDTKSGNAGKALEPVIQFDREWFLRNWRIIEDMYVRNKEILESEERSQIMPTYLILRRPDATTTVPVFATYVQHEEWMHEEKMKNNKYSDEVFQKRNSEWRTRMNWHLPPMKTSVSPEEKRRGFYLSCRRHNGGDAVSYFTPYSTARDLENEKLVDMMWCLIHSRSEELTACRTVADFTALFERTIHLEYPEWKERIHQMLRRKITPAKILWLFSQKANVFPGRGRPGTARWETVPTGFRTRESDSIYTKSMVFFTHFVCQGGEVGQKGGREETGICVVERMKQDGENAKIRWLLSAKQLHEMERVEFNPECDPFPPAELYSSDFDY
jgi:hypothetical protein